MFLEFFLLLTYWSLGAISWLVFGLAMYAGRRRMLLMYRPPHPIIGAPPAVTILIPAKADGERIRGCLLSAIEQDYPNVQVIAIDDRSTDQTGAVMDEVAASNPRLKVLHITQPPAPGWTGKNNALWTGQKLADGEWLLFVDSDMILEKDALSVAMSVVLRKKFDLLSLLPRLESHSFWESLLVPLAGSTASTMYLIALTNNAQRTNTAFANGQFLLINRTSYDAIGGHETVRDRFCEDIEIARLMKPRGMRPRVSWGNDFCSVRMYSSLGAIFRGWSRIYYSATVGKPWRPLAALMFLIFSCFSAYGALLWSVYRIMNPTRLLWGWGGIAWLDAALTHLVVMTFLIGIMYRWSGNRWRNALWFPVAGPMLAAIILKALSMCITKKVEWRGTAYSHTMAETLTAASPKT